MSRSFWRQRSNSSPAGRRCRLDKERGTPVESCSLPHQPPTRKENDMTRPITLILAALALAIAVPAAAQEGTLKKIKDSGSITNGKPAAYNPIYFYDDNPQTVGY